MKYHFTPALLERITTTLALASDGSFVQQVLAVKENKILASRNLGENHTVGLVEGMLDLVMNHMMVVDKEQRRDAASVLDAVNKIYEDYPELSTGCCAPIKTA